MEVQPLLFDPHLFGMDWMDPQWLLDRFPKTIFYLSLAMLVIECGLFFPFLPGDTLLFAMGLFIAGDNVDIVPGHHSLDLLVVLVTFTAAAFVGNVMGYEIGRKIGPPLYERDGRILKRKYFDQTHEFFEKHGTKALVIARFVPVVRTFITVVAGVTQMNRRTFFVWSFIGAALWVVSITLLGYFLGSAFPTLGERLDIALILVVAISLVPVLWEWYRHRHKRHHPVADAKVQPQPAEVPDVPEGPSTV